MAENPLILKCKACGSNTKYDIKEQSYCCTSCARKISVVDAVTNLGSWRKSQQSDIKKQLHELPHTFTHCPNCGAEFFFKENEATGICPYCDTPMIRKDYDESDSFPESIIPFKITLEEAKEKLLDLVDKPASSYSEEAEIAKKNINKMQGFYLPYSLIMGPINYNINREGTKRQFHCEIDVEKNFINGSKELDNLVLDAMEPYDWQEIVPFSFGYISGQLVKIKNIDENELTKRAVEEVANQSKKQITEELDSEAIEIKSDSVNILTAPVLLPVYYFKVGDFTVAVNGQTGRVSMTNNHEIKKIVNYSGWIVLPILIALEIIFFDSIDTFEKLEINIWYKILLYLYFFFASPLGLIFILLPKKIKTITEKLPIASDKCLAIRQPDQRLRYDYGEDVIYEEPNKLSFWELVDSKKEKILIKVFKSSTLIKLALFAMFYPICVGLVVLALVSLYHKSLPLFSNELIDILKVNGGWLIGIGSCYFFGGAIYNRIKYDFKLEKYGGREFELDKMIYSLTFIFGVVFSLIFGLFQILGIVFDDEYVKKQNKKAAIEAKIEEIHKSVPLLKQNETIIKNVINKDKIVLKFNQNQSSYFIYFFEKDKITYWLFSIMLNKDERQYNYGKPNSKEAVSKQLYKVNTYPDSFVVTDVKTNDKWKVKYDKAQILIKKVLPNNSREDNSQVLGHPSVTDNDVSSPISHGIASNATPSVELLLDSSPINDGASELKEEKTLYTLKLSSDGNSYYLIDSSGKFIGNSYIDRKSNKLYVLKQNVAGEKKSRLDYAISDHKPRTDGNMLLASPALLEIEDLDINLRYIMMLELSQLE